MWFSGGYFSVLFMGNLWKFFRFGKVRLNCDMLEFVKDVILDFCRIEVIKWYKKICFMEVIGHFGSNPSVDICFNG